MPLNKNLKATIKQGIRETMEDHILDDGIEKDAWAEAVGQWLEFTHPDYNSQLMVAARNTLLRQMVNDYIRGTRTADPNGVIDILGLRHEIELNNRIVQIREAGGAFRAKRIGDVTLRDVETVMDYYRQAGQSIDRRFAFYAAIHREMKQRGFGPNDRVSQLLLAA